VEYKQTGKLHSLAEDLFMQLFCETFGPEKSKYLFVQYPVTDIYGNSRFIDFALESEEVKIAIEIDGETYHNPSKVSNNKYYDDLLKQNSLVYDNWKVYRWVYNQLKHTPEKVKDHQINALSNLQAMRSEGESIALLYHATGTGKTVTAVSDAKSLGKRTLFLAHTHELITQAKNTFQSVWGDVTTGMYVAEQKEKDAYVVCGSIQSVARNLEDFRPEDFSYLIIDECHHGAANTYKKILGYLNQNLLWD